MGAKDRLGLNLAEGTQLDHNTPGKSLARWAIGHVAIPALPIVSLMIKDMAVPMETVTGLEGFARNAGTIALISIAGDVLGRRGALPLGVAIAATAGAVGISGEFDISSLFRQDSFPLSVNDGLNEALILSTYFLTGINSYIAKNRGDVMVTYTIAKILKGAVNLTARMLNSSSNRNDN